MNKLKQGIILVVLWFMSLLAFSEELECRTYTYEQEQTLQLAYQFGLEEDLGLTLAAIVQQESFVGPYIVRSNPRDYSVDKKTGKRIYSSLGITHVLLGTAMWLEGETNEWRARDYIATRLVRDDEYALEMALRKLKSVQGKAKNWRHLVSMYNGAGPAAEKYAKNIAKHVKQFRKCGLVGTILVEGEKEIHKFGVDGQEEVYKDWYSYDECNRLWFKD